MKKPYAKIEYLNCSPDYDTTIVPFNELAEHSTKIFIADNEDLDEEGYQHWGLADMLPEIKISLVMMTDQEYEDWFAKHVEPTA